MSQDRATASKIEFTIPIDGRFMSKDKYKSPELDMVSGDVASFEHPMRPLFTGTVPMTTKVSGTSAASSVALEMIATSPSLRGRTLPIERADNKLKPNDDAIYETNMAAIVKPWKTLNAILPSITPRGPADVICKILGVGILNVGWAWISTYTEIGLKMMAAPLTKPTGYCLKKAAEATGAAKAAFYVGAALTSPLWLVGNIVSGVGSLLGHSRNILDSATNLLTAGIAKVIDDKTPYAAPRFSWDSMKRSASLFMRQLVGLPLGLGNWLSGKKATALAKKEVMTKPAGAESVRWTAVDATAKKPPKFVPLEKRLHEEHHHSDKPVKPAKGFFGRKRPDDLIGKALKQTPRKRVNQIELTSKTPSLIEKAFKKK